MIRRRLADGTLMQWRGHHLVFRHPNGYVGSLYFRTRRAALRAFIREE